MTGSSTEKKEPLFNYGLNSQKSVVAESEPDTVCELWTRIPRGGPSTKKTVAGRWFPLRDLGTFKSPEAAWAQAQLLGAKGNDQTNYRIVAV